MRGEDASGRRLASDLRRPDAFATAFLSICLLSFLVNYGRVAFAPLVDYFIQTGTAPAVAGLAATAAWFGSAAPRLPTGWLLTFVKRPTVILGVGGALSVGALWTASAPDIRFVILGAFFIGLATGAFYIAANPFVSELYPADVGMALGLRGFFSQLAAVGAPMFVAVALWLGSWRIGFFSMTVLAIAVTLVFAGSIRRASIPDVGGADTALVRGIRAELGLVLTGIACVGFAGFVWQGVFNFYITYLSAEKALSSGVAGALLTVTFAAGLPSFLIAGRIADRFPPLWVMLWVLLAFCVSLAAVTLVDGLLAIVAVSVLLGLVVHALFPVADAYLLGTLPDNHRASAYAGYSASMMLMQAPGSVAVGSLAQVGVSYTLVFQAFAAALAVLVIMLWGLALLGRLPGS